MHRIDWLAWIAMGAAAAGSCGDGTGPDDAAILAETLRQFTGAEQSFVVGLGKGGAPEITAASAVPATCPFSPQSGFLVCPTDSETGRSVSRSYHLYDADGKILAKFDSRLVTSLHVVTSVAGSVTTLATFNSPSTSTTFSSTSSYMLSRLASSRQSISGSATTTAAVITLGKTRTTVSAQTITDVVPPNTATQYALSDGFPMSGSVTSVITGTDTAGVALLPATVTTAFNGTTTLMIQVAKSGTLVTWRCTYSRGGGAQTFVVCDLL